MRVLAMIAVFILASVVDADAQAEQPFHLFPNDLGGFLTVAGDLRYIDFETLPDGSPSQGGERITDTFNYTNQGVTFSTPLSDPFIAGPPGDRRLDALEFLPGLHTWIIADLVTPSRAVGIEFGGISLLSAYDVHGDFIASVLFSAPGGPWFLGIVSDIPIARVTSDDGDNSETILTFIFNPTPEPASAVLLGAAGLLGWRRRRGG